MPTHTYFDASSDDEFDATSTFAKKNVSFYFPTKTPSVSHRASEPTYLYNQQFDEAYSVDGSEMGTEYSDSEYFDDASEYSDETSEYELTEEEYDAYLRAEAAYLNQYDMHKIDQQLQQAQLQRDMAQETHLDKAYYERADLVMELKGFQQLAATLDKEYANKKAKNYNNAGRMSGFFAKKEPAQDRLDAIARIQQTVKDVVEHLASLKVSSANFGEYDSLAAMRYQIQHLEQGVLAIKGAALQEFKAISDTYKLQQPSNSALHNVLQSTFNCAKMSAEEATQAESALKQVKSDIASNAQMQQRIDAEANSDRPTAMVI